MDKNTVLNSWTRSNYEVKKEPSKNEGRKQKIQVRKLIGGM